MNFSNFKISIAFDHESFTKINYRPFIAGVIAVFIFKIFTLLGVIDVPAFLSPIPEKIEKYESLRPRLEQKVNDFKLAKTHSIIPVAYAGEDFDSAKAYVVFDLDTGEVLAEKDISTKASIASITKVMTAVVALDLASPDELFTVSKKASEQIPTKIGVVPGEQMTLSELLHASLLTSANDASAVIQEGIDEKYGEPVFIRAMNEKATFIGMNATSFENPQGFDDEDHYSTPEDLAILTHYAMTEYPLIREIVKKEYQKLEANEHHKQFDLYNWNGLLGVYPNTYGVKIGNTDEAGVTTMVAAEREGKNIGVILLGAPGVLERDLWAAKLLDLGFKKNNIESVSIDEEDLREKYGTWEYWYE